MSVHRCVEPAAARPFNDHIITLLPDFVLATCTFEQKLGIFIYSTPPMSVQLPSCAYAIRLSVGKLMTGLHGLHTGTNICPVKK